MATNSIRVELAPDDYVSANFLHVRPQRMAILILIGAALMGAVAAGVQLWYHEPVNALVIAQYVVGYAIFIGLVASFWRYVALPIRARQVYGQQKALKLPQTYTWDDQILLVETSRGRAAMPWSDFLRWRANERLFLLYASDVSFYMIPKRAFVDAEQLSGFEQLIREKIAPKPGVKRKGR